jgi:hypothetical protein
MARLALNPLFPLLASYSQREGKGLGAHTEGSLLPHISAKNPSLQIPESKLVISLQPTQEPRSLWFPRARGSACTIRVATSLYHCYPSEDPAEQDLPPGSAPRCPKSRRKIQDRGEEQSTPSPITLVQRIARPYAKQCCSEIARRVRRADYPSPCLVVGDLHYTIYAPRGRTYLSRFFYRLQIPEARQRFQEQCQPHSILAEPRRSNMLQS